MAQFAHHEVAAIETEIVETLGRSVGGQPGITRFFVTIVFGDHGPGRLLVMSVDVTDEYFAQRNAMPLVVLGRRTIAHDNDVAPVRLLVCGVIRDWLRKPVRESEVFSSNSVQKPEVERQAMHRPYLLGVESLRNLASPFLNGVVGLVV